MKYHIYFYGKKSVRVFDLSNKQDEAFYNSLIKNYGKNNVVLVEHKETKK